MESGELIMSLRFTSAAIVAAWIIVLSPQISWGQGGPASGEMLRIRDRIIQLDSNQDTVIEADEVPEEGRAAFDRLVKLGDSNKNGKLEGDELRAMGQKVRALAPGSSAEDMPRFRAMDSNGDGSLSREEFRGAKAVFDRLDADKDSALSQKEFAEGALINGGKALVARL